MWRKLLGIVVGILLANLVAWGWEVLLLPLTPFAPELGADAVVAEGPYDVGATALVWIGFGWTLAAFLGALAAFRIGHSDFTGWVVAAVVAGISITALFAGPSPFWLSLWAVAGPFIGALFAFGVWRRMRAAMLHVHHPPGHDDHWH